MEPKRLNQGRGRPDPLRENAGRTGRRGQLGAILALSRVKTTRERKRIDRHDALNGAAEDASGADAAHIHSVRRAPLQPIAQMTY